MIKTYQNLGFFPVFDYFLQANRSEESKKKPPLPECARIEINLARSKPESCGFQSVASHGAVMVPWGEGPELP